MTVEEEVFDLIRNSLGRANMFAFGIGSSVNRHIIEGMAHVGMGEAFVITKPEEAPAQAERFRAMIQTPVLTGIQVRFEGFDVYDVEPPQVPDLFAERPVVVFGKWRGKPKGKNNPERPDRGRELSDGPGSGRRETRPGQQRPALPLGPPQNHPALGLQPAPDGRPPGPGGHRPGIEL